MGSGVRGGPVRELSLVEMLGNPSKLSGKTARKVPVVHVGEADLAPTGLTLSLTKQALRMPQWPRLVSRSTPPFLGYRLFVADPSPGTHSSSAGSPFHVRYR